MASLPTRELKIGTIIDKTLGVLEINAATALIYLLALTAAGAAITLASIGSTDPTQVDPMHLVGGQVLRTLIATVAGYFLLGVMLRRTGLQSRTGGDTFLQYFGMSLLASLAVFLGMIFFVIPGIILMTRWSIGYPTLIARGGGIKASLGESWERTRGNEFSIIVAGIAVVLLPIVVIIAGGAFFGQNTLVGTLVSEFATSVINLTMMAMGTALFALLGGREAAAASAA